MDCHPLWHNLVHRLKYPQHVLRAGPYQAPKRDVAVSHAYILPGGFRVAFWIPPLYCSQWFPRQATLSVLRDELLSVVDRQLIPELPLRLCGSDNQVVNRGSIAEPEPRIVI